MVYTRLLKIVLMCSMISAYWINLNASHILGGDVTYNLIGYNADSSLVTYSIEFIIYRDTAGLDFDVLGDFGIFRQTVDGPWSSYDVVNGIPIGPVRKINALDDPCKDEILSDIIIESATYNFNITLEVGAYNYMIAYQRCCRNYTISNILNPGETGAVYDIIITPEAQQLGNNSPVFKEFPPIFVCLGFDFDFDHSANDLEGDELVYSFCTPFISGVNPGSAPAICCDCVKPDPGTCLPDFDLVTYQGIYDESNPVGGDPQIVINANTGRISGVPNIMGSFVVGICVEELRDGVVIGNYRRDFEFNVEVCTPRIVADLLSDSLVVDTMIHREEKIHSFTSCEGDLLIENLSTDLSIIYDYKWIIYDENDGLVVTEEGPSARNLLLNLPGSGTYHGYMIINDLDKCVDTAFLKIDVLPSVDLAFEYQFDVCATGPLTFTNTSIFDTSDNLEWEWVVNQERQGDGLNFIVPRPIEGDYSVELIVTDESLCSSSVIQEFTYELYNQPAITQLIEKIICPGDTIRFYEQTITLEGLYQEAIKTQVGGCDSLIKQLEASFFLPPLLNSIDTILCNGESILFNNEVLRSTGEYGYSKSYENADCDSVVYELKLTISDFPVFIEIDTSLCASDSILFENRWIKNSGRYERTVKSISSECDSFTFVLNAHFFEETEMRIANTTICEGDSVFFGDEWLVEPGFYKDILYSSSGCDSIEDYLELIVSDPLIIQVVYQESILPYLDHQIETTVNALNPIIEWLPVDGLNCSNCLNPIVNIRENRTYNIVVSDEYGCIASEQISFLVDPEIDFYLPNVISKYAPLNALNQFFFLQCSTEYTFQYDMSIFDRWGSEVGHFKNIETNVADDGWYAQDFLPGIYVYYIQILDDISPNVLVGDVTVIR